jgi:hypothetical protein
MAMSAQCASATQLVVASEQLEAATTNGLVIVPDGGVTHLTELRVRALGRLREPGDSLIYDTDTRQLTVRKSLAPSELILSEPLAPVTVGPATFAGIDPLSDASLYDPMTDAFYLSGSNRPYVAEQFDAFGRLTFVGQTIASYAATVPPTNPFQLDTDGDGVPDLTDNCLLLANGPADGATAGASQYDTDGDGFGNRCDADLDNDCAVNVVDLGLLRLSFFAQGVLDADFNGDGVVNFLDLGILRALFFQPPGPSALITCQ